MALELLSPAGSPEALRAAVQSGCGAVYLGWGSFNARRSAKNFSDEEFADAIRYCHLRGVRVFLTLNTLLTDRELPLALDAARTACRLGVDSVLVQDWGLFALLREALPDLPLHASTQMSVFTAGGANEVYGDGCERVVIARECSREDTAAICKACPAEIEIFGHGALCMCYSGQCEMSALIGGRSGERVLRAPADGIFEPRMEIGQLVQEGEIAATVNGKPMRCTLTGCLRGLLQGGLQVHEGMKCGDIDPRGQQANCFTASDKATAIGGGVLEALLHFGCLPG